MCLLYWNIHSKNIYPKVLSVVNRKVKKTAEAQSQCTGKNKQENVTLSGETLSGEIFVGRNYSSGEIFVTKQKIRHFRPTKNFAWQK